MSTSLPAGPIDDAPTWSIAWDPRADRSGPWSELVATVDGAPVRVRASAPVLRHRSEAWATAFAFAAAREGVGLEVPTPVDRTWLAGAARNVATVAEWWGGSTQVALDAPSRRRPTLRRRRPAAGRALCFTGGVDSFYALVRGGHEPTHLLYVHGFDVDLDDVERRRMVSDDLQAVARAQGLELLELETDLRRHPRFDAISWEHSHGSALVAMAMLAADAIGELVIAPSCSEDRMHPWGSRPDLDPNWSVPGVLRVLHGDVSEHRIERTAAIASDPLARRYLRVCWEHRSPARNCGQCEKCLRTMTALASLGVLDDFETFGGTDGLIAGLDAVTELSPIVRASWADLLEGQLPTNVTGAIGRMLEQTAP